MNISYTVLCIVTKYWILATLYYVSIPNIEYYPQSIMYLYQIMNTSHTLLCISTKDWKIYQLLINGEDIQQYVGWYLKAISRLMFEENITASIRELISRHKEINPQPAISLESLSNVQW